MSGQAAKPWDYCTYTCGKGDWFVETKVQCVGDYITYLLIICCVQIRSETGAALWSRGGGGVLPIMACTGRLSPKGVPFSGFRYKKKRGISQVEVYKRVGKSVI